MCHSQIPVKLSSHYLYLLVFLKTTGSVFHNRKSTRHNVSQHFFHFLIYPLFQFIYTVIDFFTLLYRRFFFINFPFQRSNFLFFFTNVFPHLFLQIFCHRTKFVMAQPFYLLPLCIHFRHNWKQLFHIPVRFITEQFFQNIIKTHFKFEIKIKKSFDTSLPEITGTFIRTWLSPARFCYRFTLRVP